MHFYSIYILSKKALELRVTEQTWQYPKSKMPQHWKKKKAFVEKQRLSCSSSYKKKKSVVKFRLFF